MKNWSSTKGLKYDECPWLIDRQDALRVAAFLRIPLHTLDFEKQYQKTVNALADVFINTVADKIISQALALISDWRNSFHLAAFDRTGEVIGAVAATVHEMPWFERCEAHVIQFRALDVWVGMRLLREMKRWADADMRIRRVVWVLELGADAGMAAFARK